MNEQCKAHKESIIRETVIKLMSMIRCKEIKVSTPNSEIINKVLKEL